jgi:hypothetical protein
MVVVATPRTQLGSRPSDQRALRMVFDQQCPSWCVPG